MPKPSPLVLIWSEEQRCYDLYIGGQHQRSFHHPDEPAWLAWVHEQTAFAFQGQAGHLSVIKEAQPRGSQYWYAHRRQAGRTRKRYLGSSAQLTFARLEETAQALARASTSLSPTASSLRPAEQSLLLSSKLSPPRLPNSLVERERLLAALDGALATPLTLLSAPAGWGKTTLLSAWASRQLAQVAWLSLEELDNSPTRFWVALIAALRRCQRSAPQLGETPVALLQSPQPPPLSSILTALLHELETREVYPAPIVLILDDYQVIGEQTIHEGITFWVEHQPAHLHLLLASRVDPDLPQMDEISPEIKVTRAGAAEAFPPKDLETLAAEEALLHRRLHLLRAGLAWYEAFATQEYERLSALQQEIQELDQDEEVTWQMLPLSWSFVLHYTVRQEGARLLPQLLEAKRWVSQSGSHFAVIRIRQWLAMAAVEAGHLHLAYEESQAALALIEQMKGFVLLKGYFEVVQTQVLYRWNRLKEARELLHTVVHDAAAWQQLDLLGIGYFYLMRVELAAGDLSVAQQARREAEQLVLLSLETSAAPGVEEAAERS